MKSLPRPCLVTVHQHLGGAAAGVVVGAHDEAVGAGRTHRQQVTFGQCQLAILGEEVAGLADRPDDVVVARIAFVRLHRDHVHPRLVQRRTDQVVHRCIDDGEILVRGVLEILHAGQQQAGVGDDGAARLEHQRQATAFDALAHGLDVVTGQRWLFVAIAHPETAAQVQVTDLDAARGEPIDQRQQAVEGIEEGRQAGQLRADVAVDADHFQVRQLGRAGVDRLGVVDIDAELVLFQPGGDVGMGAGIHVWIDPQGNRRLHAQFGGDLLQTLQLVGGLDVEAVHTDFQRAAHVVASLADAGEDDAARLAAGGEHALQFTARDDVEARAETCQHVQDTEVRVGLDGEADQVRHAFQRIGVSPVLGLDVGAGIDVGRRAEALRECGQCHALREELTVAVREGLHEQPPLEFETVFGTFFDGLLVIRQIQRTFLAAAAERGGEDGESDEGKQKALHGDWNP